MNDPIRLTSLHNLSSRQNGSAPAHDEVTKHSAPLQNDAPLPDVSVLIEACAAWNYAQWGVFGPHRLAHSVELFMRAAEDDGALPLTLVALRGERPLGMASLVQHDGDMRPELGPWLASVFVHPNERRQGVADRLIEAVTGLARARGEPRLYLFTPDCEALYERHGFRAFETTRYQGLPCTIMVKALDPMEEPNGHAPASA